MPGTEFEVTDLPGVQRRTDPGIVFPAPQQMPDDHRQLASGRDGSNVLATIGGSVGRGTRPGAAIGNFGIIDPRARQCSP
jgi:hypothetical protein